MSLVEKYNISEKDAYTLSEIEILKGKEGLFSLKKEKLKAKSMQVLKPYKVKFMDLGNLIIEIKKNPDYNSQMMKEKYGKIESDNLKSDFSWTYKILIGCLVVAGVIIFSNYTNQLKPEKILGKEWEGRYSYSVIGNAYTAKIHLTVTSDNNKENPTYSYHLLKDIYENGYFIRTTEKNGVFQTEPKIYKQTVAGTEYTEKIWMFDDEEYGLILENGEPVYPNALNESIQTAQLRFFKGDVCITMK
jgi:hypothetical protein